MNTFTQTIDRIVRFSLPLLAAPVLLTAQTATTPEAQQLLQHVQYLASPELEGRGPGTEGNTKAAAYIEDQFRKAGLKPGAGSSFQQSFTMPVGMKLTGTNGVMFDVLVERPGVPPDQLKPTKIGWKLGIDYQPYAFSESGTVTGAVVFAGYGISAPDKGYDDYAGIDVKGKIVLVLRGVPRWADKDEALKAHGALRKKATIARDKGAVAVCFVNQQGDLSDVLEPFGMERLGKNSGIVAVQVRRTPCARIFPPKETSLFVAEGSIEKTRKPASFALKNTTATITVTIEGVDATTSNVIGIVPGTDPALAKEVVVVGAHFDHLGLGDENSLSTAKGPAIHPGADDNASGTAGMMELARRFAAAPGKRTIAFIGFSGEEKGLVGSKHFTNNPTIALSDVVAMVNLDMIGRLKDNKLNIQGTGTATEWPGIIDRAKADLPFVLSTTADGFGPSDHSSFTAKNIPVLFFFTGLHTDYHRPSDTYDKINYDGQAQVVTMVERTVREIAALPVRPVFTQAPASPGKQQSASAGFKVTLGVIPDYSDDPQGLRITGVKPGSPAEKGGLQADDIITKMGSTMIKNIYDLTSVLGERNPGDVVDVTVLRNGTSKSMKVTLTGK